ncbi:class I SAM-dependent methyltransferase [Nocardioides jensenii]|uniref:class I SAM-dependent methyltransferase n=1 Tax=Nocardioides jensenii TaxID=1843 RepID=UPI00082FEA77|nr:class I SAM-dependent methyltransferase [Nocardioides jensenii]
MAVDTRGARNWSGLAPAYADTFAHLCAGTIPALLDAAGLAPEHDVLEVGVGSGLLAARIAASGARLTATEPEPDMRAIARTNLPADVEVVAAGLPDLPFGDDAFDTVIANFVVNHVGDPRAGVRELARVTRHGGRVLLTIWPSTPTAQGTLFTVVLDRAGATPPTFDTLPTDLDFERSTAGTLGLLGGAGLVDVHAREIALVWRIGPDRFWAGLEAGIGGIGKALLQQDDVTQRRMRAAYDDLSRGLLDGDELVFPATAILAGGVR